jgi:hypothetical protein
MRLPLLAVLAPACLLAGCVDYLNNRDTVTFGAGNAAAANRAIMTARPYNPESKDVSIATGADQALAARRLLILPPGTVAPPTSSTTFGAGPIAPAE